MFERIIYSEAHRAVRIHPAWRSMFRDLVQDAWEAVIRYAPAEPPHVRICARGAIVRCALDYLGVNRRTGARPEFIEAEDRAASDSRFAEYEGAQTLAYLGRRVAKKHVPRDVAVWQLHVAGEGGAAIGRAMGVSRERVRQVLVTLYDTARRAA